MQEQEASRFSVEGKTGAARRFFKKRDPQTQEIIRQAINKVCDNPFTDHRKRAIRFLQGRWEGFQEYRIQDPLLRIIYQVTDPKKRLLYIEEILTHL